MGTERRLIALYLLTVADIRGTSPKVWNDWKGKLLEDLYHATRAVLAGDDRPRARCRTASKRAAPRRSGCCACTRCPTTPKSTLWKHLDTPYFQRHTAEEIAWHARHLYWRVERRAPVVKARLSRDGAGLQVLVYLPDQKELFARMCGFFGRTGLSILRGQDPHDALGLRARHVHAARSGAARTLVSRDASSTSSTSSRALLAATAAARSARRWAAVSRRLKHFPLTPEVQIFPDDKGTHYILEVVAGDRPGLLASIAYTLAQANVNVASAKINTLGDRAEDVFLIEGARLHDEQALLRLETALYEQLRTD